MSPPSPNARSILRLLSVARRFERGLVLLRLPFGLDRGLDLLRLRVGARRGLFRTNRLLPLLRALRLALCQRSLGLRLLLGLAVLLCVFVARGGLGGLGLPGALG